MIKSKIKAKIIDNILHIKFMIHNKMIGEHEAEKKNIAEDYITHILLHVGERILFDFKSSGNISQNPLFKLKFKQKELKIGDQLELEWKTISNEKGYDSKKIK